jgi:OOP family OmpA-OmpF porin
MSPADQTTKVGQLSSNAIRGKSQMSKGRILAIAATVGLMAAAPSVWAQQGFYIGAGGGFTLVEVADVPVTGATVTSRSKDEKDAAFKIFGGYQFNRYVGVEAGYVDLGKYSTTVNTTAGSMTIDVSLDGWFVEAVGLLPLANNFSLFGKLGTVWGTAKASARTTGAIRVTGMGTDDDLSGKIGLGMQYEFANKLGIRAEYEFYGEVGGSNGGDVNYFGASLYYKF